MGRPPQRSQKQLLADQLSAGPTLVLRAKPKKDESYLGFLLRLTEINAYDTPYWIVKEADLRPETFHGMCSFVSDPEVDLVPLSELTRLKLNDLKKLVYYPACDKYGVTILGQTLPRYLLRLRKSRVCPKCLSQSNYCRKQWDFAAVTSCPVHHIMLLEECHVCVKKITFVRKGVSRCPCGADWREAQMAPLLETETVVSRLMYQTFGEMKPASNDSKTRNPLYGLDLSSILEGLFLVASQRERRLDLTGKYLLARKTTREIHDSLLRAYSVFEHWPANFHKFLDQVRAQNKSSNTSIGLKSNFGAFYRRLYSSRAVSQSLGQILRTEFERYLSEHWDDGYLAKAKWFKSSKAGGRYVSKTRACRALNLDPATLDRLVSNGKLKAVVRSNGAKRLFLVEISSVKQLKLEVTQYLSVEEVSSLLGTSRLNVRRLVETSLLIPADGASVDKPDIWKFDKAVVNSFLTSTLSKTVSLKLTRTGSLRNFTTVLDLLQRKLTSTGYGVDTLVGDIRTGLLTPRDESPGKPGLSRLRFLSDEVQEYLHTKLAGRTNEKLRVIGGVKQLEIDPKVAYFLAGKGLIATNVGTRQGKKDRTITPEAVLSFKTEYKFAIEVAREIGTTTNFLIKALRPFNVHPVSGKSVDGGPKYVYRTEDLHPLDLKKLKALLPRKKSTSSHAIDSAEAARILSVDTETISELIANGLLRPYPGTRSFLFNRTSVERYKAQFRNLAELVSSKGAARLLNVDLVNLHERWVKRGYLQYEISKDGKKRFFRKSDVQQIASFIGAVVTGVEAALLLGVPRHYVQQWTRAKLLIPVANPYPRAFRSFLYSRADLVNLSVIHHRSGIYKKTLLRVATEN